MSDKKLSLTELEARVMLALRHALTLAAVDDSPVTIAWRVYTAERELSAALAPYLVVGHYRRILDRLAKPQDDRQPPLPGINLLPQRISVSPKKTVPKVPFRQATLPQLLAYRKELVRHKDKRIAQLDVYIRFMQKHAPRSRKVTLGELVEKYGQGELGLQA